MRHGRTVTIFLVLTALALCNALAADKWLHVRVDDGGADQERVSVNIPLNLVETMLPLIDIDEFQHGKLDLGHDLDGIDLKELALAMRESPDAEFVTVENKDEKLRVEKRGEFLVIRAEETGRRSTERVLVKMPIAVLEALVGGEGDELDLVAAVRELARHEDEAIVDIVSDDSSVRVWIDSDGSGR